MFTLTYYVLYLLHFVCIKLLVLFNCCTSSKTRASGSIPLHSSPIREYPLISAEQRRTRTCSPRASQSRPSTRSLLFWLSIQCKVNLLSVTILGSVGLKKMPNPALCQFVNSTFCLDPKDNLRNFTNYLCFTPFHLLIHTDQHSQFRLYKNGCYTDISFYTS